MICGFLVWSGSEDGKASFGGDLENFLRGRNGGDLEMEELGRSTFLRDGDLVRRVGRLLSGRDGEICDSELVAIRAEVR